MGKITAYIVFTVFATFFVQTVDASIVTVGKTGEVVVNVLSAEDSSEDISESIKISKSSVEMGEADIPISLFSRDGKHILSIAAKNGERTFDVSGYSERILEIEERPSVKKIGIALFDNRFVIEQSGIRAKTSYQINIEPQRSRITILTPTGYKFLTMLPKEAVDILIRSKSISSLSLDRVIEITEDASGNLLYEVNGFKHIGIKDVYTYDVPVSAKIAINTGQILEVDQPIWLKILSMFTVET